MDGKIIQYLNNKYGYNLESSYYSHIQDWKDWWKGLYEPFHKYRESSYNGTVVERELYTLKMAKKVCEDWASLLVNEKTYITINDEALNNYVNKILEDNNFWSSANGLVEKAFATGTGAFALRLNNGNIKISYIDAECIVPISWNNGKITEIAFASEIHIRGNKYFYIESHLLDRNNTYVIHNEFLDKNFKPVPVPDGVDVLEDYKTNSNVPWFTVLTPNIVNNVESNCQMGVSVFANAIDCLKGVDLAFNNFCKDFKLGGKKVFIDKSLTETVKGKTITPDDNAQQLFINIGDSLLSDNNKPLIHEHNPQLRVNENIEGIQAQLNYLSSKCGLGERYYSFNNGSVATATQIISENSTLFRNIKKHEIIIEQCLIDVVKGILSIGKHNQEAQINIVFDDSIIEDKVAERQRDLQEVSAGIMNKTEYRMKWYGESEEEAKKNLPQMENLLLGD